MAASTIGNTVESWIHVPQRKNGKSIPPVYTWLEEDTNSKTGRVNPWGDGGVEVEKMELDIPMDAKVLCSGKVCGHITHIILNPVTNKVTDVVIRDYEIPRIERLIPVELITRSSSDTVQLDISQDRIVSFPSSRHTNFIKIKSSSKSVTTPIYMMWSYVTPQERSIPIESQSLPPEELAVRCNAHVKATDGRVGKVDEFMIDPHTGLITHLVLHEGHLWGQKNISIPVSAIQHIGKDTVRFTLDKKSIEKLPVILIHRIESFLNRQRENTLHT
jgi:sporulation protein YlmC with PRC-barrel domain